MDDAATVADIRKAIKRLGWKHPFFMIPGMNIAVRVVDAIPTAGITKNGTLYVNPKFWASLTQEQQQGLMAHEIYHPLLAHAERCGSRDMKKFNIAADMALNRILREAGIELPPGGLFPPGGMEDWTAEQIYDALPAKAGQGNKGDATAGCGESDLPDGLGTGEELANQGGESKTQSQWKEIAAQAASCAAGSALANAVKMPPPRVAWDKLLKRTVANASATATPDRTTWRRVSRRSTNSVLFPSRQSTAARVAVIIDTSGSVPEESLEAALAETVAVTKLSGVSLYLITHDARVQWHGWIVAGKRGEASIKSSLIGRGGTEFRPAYEVLAATRAKFDALIHLTDGYPCDTWPSKPPNVRQAIAALVGHSTDVYIPSGWRSVLVERP